jgi:hypothetical protein
MLAAQQPVLFFTSEMYNYIITANGTQPHVPTSEILNNIPKFCLPILAHNPNAICVDAHIYVHTYIHYKANNKNIQSKKGVLCQNHSAELPKFGRFTEQYTIYSNLRNLPVYDNCLQ